MGDIRFKLLATMAIALAVGMGSNGCSAESSKPYDRALVTTYAELTLLYEKEKMTKKVSDSLYQLTVDDFFRGKGYEQKKFRSVIDDLSEYPEAWKMFLQDVTTAMDSIRNDTDKKAREAQPGNEDGKK
jgi:hypothetical protein